MTGNIPAMPNWKPENIRPTLGGEQAQEELRPESPVLGGIAVENRNKEHLAMIEHKISVGEQFDREDLVMIYGLNGPIEGFGNEENGRIMELRAHRNVEADLTIIFECTPEQIAHHVSEIREDTKVYIGPLEPNVFSMLPEDCDEVYLRFPERKITHRSIELGGKTAKELEEWIVAQGMGINPLAKHMMTRSGSFATSKEMIRGTIVMLTVAELGLEGGVTTQEIYNRAKELGLSLCPAEVGPQLRAQWPDQPFGDTTLIGMKAIDSGGDPDVFSLESIRGDSRMLWSSHGEPDYQWPDRSRWTFLRRSTVLST